MTPVRAFLTQYGWDNAKETPLAGDASARRYIRLYSGQKRAILMIDPTDDVARFARVGEYLASVGLTAPRILAAEPGLMLLEDFGDDQFTSVIAKTPNMEIPLYKTACDVLCHLETVPTDQGLTAVTPQIFGEMLDPVFSRYAAVRNNLDKGMASDLTRQMVDLLDSYLPPRTVTVLRDFHAENMIWLPDRDGIKRVGLLDFQDALIGPPVYDLVSMLQDARRDVSDDCRIATIRHYCDMTGQTEDTVLPVYHLLGLQRNLRILGIFAALAAGRGKPSYLALIPRVWGHIQTSLNAPVAARLKPLVESILPEPSHAYLAMLEHT